MSESPPGAGGAPQGGQAAELVLGKPAPRVVMGRHLEVGVEEKDSDMKEEIEEQEGEIETFRS